MDNVSAFSCVNEHFGIKQDQGSVVWFSLEMGDEYRSYMSVDKVIID
jgi:hypothetical protein